MKLIVDTNILIAALIKDSTARKLITHLNAELITLSFSIQELEKYKPLILKKACITENELVIILEFLKSKLIFLEDSIVQKEIEEARKIMGHIDHDDIPFLAAALATEADIWSDDLHFQKQNKVRVWRTKDLVEMI
ncbi:PIN domain-containing protein [Candidatus Woesearchaeota archaeon]|nr:PIN domain-containing protein [Candidatus Woesearchaeota archaeon]